jgi:hypothetical protein
MIRRTLLVALATGFFLAFTGFASDAEALAGSQLASQRSGATGEAGSRTATGIVSEVNCANGLKVQVDTPEGMKSLRRQPGTLFHITAPTSAQENINPCTSLKGLLVSVQYIPDDEKGMTGKMERVQILLPEDAGNAVLPASQPHKDAPSKGPLMEKTTSEGRVKKVHCDGKELLITFVVRDVEFSLHARDYTRLDIDEGTAMQSGTYDPCAKLSGHDATVTYLLIEKKSYDGEMQAITVVP